MHSSNGLLKGLAVCGATCLILLSSCGDKKPVVADSKPAAETAGAKANTPSGKIAYVDMDTLEAKYTYLKTKRAELEKETAAFDAEIGRMTQNLQNEYIALQKKAQAGTLTSSEGQEGEKKLGQMQQNIEARKQTMGSQLMKKQEAFNKDLQSRLDAYLLKYNADKGYDYILSYTKGGAILYVNKALDITEDVVKGMNEESGPAAAGTN